MDGFTLSTFLVFVGVGFVAQMIDGALGMAYGVSSNAFLLSIGIPPSIASACVHLAEVVTTGVSGISHWKLGNIDIETFKKLIVPGILGGVAGAYLLTSIDGDAIKPFVSIYLLIMGLSILWKAFRKKDKEERSISWIIPLGLVGGFFDAIGGGGWGPIVTTTLIARGNNPRLSIGSVNSSEFFVTFAESVTFILTIGGLFTHWPIIVGLLLGGVAAAPLAAIAAKRVPTKILMILVGILIIVLSLRTIIASWI